MLDLTLRTRLEMLHAIQESFAAASPASAAREAAEHLIAARNAAVWEDAWTQPDARCARLPGR